MREIEIRQTLQYSRWFSRLRDLKARARIDVRIRRLSLGLPGDHRTVGQGVVELKIDHGPGYRVYFTRHRHDLVILLAGGDKSSQQDDIRKAIELSQALEE